MKPLFTYELDTFELSLEARPWAIEVRTVGADDVAASGIPEAFVIREDQVRRFTLRFTETEWVDWVQPWLSWARGSGATFQFQWDSEDPATEAIVYLDSPRISDGNLQPTRDQSYLWVLELDVGVRTSDGLPFPGTWDQE